MIIEIRVPSPGESITEVEIARWFVANGDFVEKDQEIADIESDKATLQLIAAAEGEISILKGAGVAIPVGEVVCKIDTSKQGNRNPAKWKTEIKESIQSARAAESQKIISAKVPEKESQKKEEKAVEIVKITPVARQMMEEKNLSVDDIIKGLKKITSIEVNAVLSSSFPAAIMHNRISESSRDEKRNRMSVLRRKLSQRLVNVKNEFAMLTTFNEVDMSIIIELRKKYQDAFLKKHEVKLGFMSFFTKAVSEALKSFPMVNSRIDGEDIITPEYTDIAIAVQTEKGLMVPVLRNVETLGLADIEKIIIELANKARTNKLSIEEMTGGTFTITNGGIYGSLLSTPIINPPQSAILGMHNIIERPIALNGQVVIRPMMYLALSYDHRIIDGRDSVSFLVKVKEMIEDPQKLLFDGNDPLKILLNI
jgi:2-oxoglutarate dehydrogenase E2 component (dihydrolipoamide succinyltransferase)